MIGFGPCLGGTTRAGGCAVCRVLHQVHWKFPSAISGWLVASNLLMKSVATYVDEVSYPIFAEFHICCRSGGVEMDCPYTPT